MKKSSASHLWLYFAAIIFAVILLVSLIMTGIALVLYHTGYFGHSDGNLYAPLVGLLLLSLMLGTILSFFVARRILAPMAEFSRVSGQVAQGNFAVQIDESSSVKEVADLSRNFNLMIRELSKMEALGSDFVSNVSHEFNTPLSTIEGYATLLQDPGLSQQDHDEYVGMIIRSTRQLGSLSGNILQLSNLEQKEMLLEKKAFRLDEQIRQAILSFAPQWSEKELDLQINLPFSEYIGNERLLMHVWMNLIGNAVKFTPSGGTIEIALTAATDNTVVTFSDTGCGISESNISRIFDKFYQSDNSRQSEGNGLGLALAKRIVDLSGGTIIASSTESQGSTFTVILNN